MNICPKCGFENNDDVNKCSNCLIDIHWAKVNLGMFHGNMEDTRKIGIESRKQLGLPVPEDEITPLAVIQSELEVPKKHSKLSIASFACALLFLLFWVGNFLASQQLDGTNIATAEEVKNIYNFMSIYQYFICGFSLLNPISILLGAIVLSQKTTKKLFAILGISLSLLSGCFVISYFFYLLSGM